MAYDYLTTVHICKSAEDIVKGLHANEPWIVHFPLYSANVKLIDCAQTILGTDISRDNQLQEAYIYIDIELGHNIYPYQVQTTVLLGVCELEQLSTYIFIVHNRDIVILSIEEAIGRSGGAF